MRELAKPTLQLLGALVALTVAGCLADFNNQTAYEGQTYLCDAEGATAFAELLSGCENDRARGLTCGGVISLRGTLQGDFVTIESTLQAARFRNATVTGSPDVFLNQVELSGRGPYFLFTFKMSSLGGIADTANATIRPLQWDTDAADVDPPLASVQDDLTRGDLRIENGRENEEVFVLEGFGSANISFQGPGELAGDFAGSFGIDTDQIEGCFHAFATEVRLESL